MAYRPNVMFSGTPKPITIMSMYVIKLMLCMMIFYYRPNVV